MFAYQIDLFKQRAACTECIILKKLAPAAHCSSIELTYKHSAPQGAESKNCSVRHLDCLMLMCQFDLLKQRAACNQSIKKNRRLRRIGFKLICRLDIQTQRAAGAEFKNCNVGHFDCLRLTCQSDRRKLRTACTESIKIKN